MQNVCNLNIRSFTQDPDLQINASVIKVLTQLNLGYRRKLMIMFLSIYTLQLLQKHMVTVKYLLHITISCKIFLSWHTIDTSWTTAFFSSVNCSWNRFWNFLENKISAIKLRFKNDIASNWCHYKVHTLYITWVSWLEKKNISFPFWEV